ncbi:MAG: hypothetical protein DCC58_19835 [Chloroflexi bacterium]|nr:MAG: hypothetical protein DCC58_19835 [Chloroflexota bacterium]
MLQRKLPALGLFALGIGTAASSLLGPLGAGVIQWRISPDMEDQLLGGDAVGLFLVAPVAVIAGLRWWRGHSQAAALALGPALYGIYTYFVAILLPEYERFAGNNERAFPLYLVLLWLSWLTAAAAWHELGRQASPQVEPRLRRMIAVPVNLVGSLMGLAWIGQIATVMGGDTTQTGYLDHPTGFWLIRTLDLGLVIPVSLATGIGLLRGGPLAMRATYAVLPFLTLMTASVAGMGIAMLVRDSADATVVFPAVLTPIAVLLGYLTFRLLRSGPAPLHATMQPAPPAFTRIEREFAPTSEGSRS